MMRLFLDTEFTDLVPGAKLISIALVDENGESFYAELTDTYTHDDCSDFVKAYVLPFLKGGPYLMTQYECSIALGNWIDDRETECIIANDNPSWDVPYLNMLLKHCWPQNLVNDYVYLVRLPDQLKEDIVIENDFDIHNALDDAKVMQLGAKILETKIL